MKTWIALFKGINVGGNNKIAMKDLVMLFEELGCTDVKTYIQSGNVVFRSSGTNATALTNNIAGAVQSKLGLTTALTLIDARQLSSAIASNPYTEADTEARTLHAFFLFSPVTEIDQARLDKVIKPGERWTHTGQVVYLHTPEGAGNSKLATQVEKITGVLATARNWRTVCTLEEMVNTTVSKNNAV